MCVLRARVDRRERERERQRERQREQDLQRERERQEQRRLFRDMQRTVEVEQFVETLQSFSDEVNICAGMSTLAIDPNTTIFVVTF